MIMTNKLLPVALVAALIGGSVGAVVMHSRNQTTTPTATSSTLAGTDAQYQAGTTGNAQFIPAEYQTGTEQNAYKAGFADGFRQCESAAGSALSAANYQTNYQSGAPRLVSRNSGRYYAHTTSTSGTTYVRPRGRSFWQKHRDKLTVAMGTGGGAIIGGLIGGRKGAAIGALGGAGGSALYTYKIRKRNRRY
jgi:hypothetical protein